MFGECGGKRRIVSAPLNQVVEIDLVLAAAQILDSLWRQSGFVRNVFRAFASSVFAYPVHVAVLGVTDGSFRSRITAKSPVSFTECIKHGIPLTMIRVRGIELWVVRNILDMPRANAVVERRYSGERHVDALPLGGSGFAIQCVAITGSNKRVSQFERQNSPSQ